MREKRSLLEWQSERQRKLFRLALEAKNLRVPATSDAHPPTYGGLVAFCEVLQLIGGHSGLVETMLCAIEDARIKARRMRKKNDQGGCRDR
jgi:hypothetical protein